MSVRLAMQVNNGDTLGALREFLKMLFAQKIIDTLLVPLEVPSAEQIMPTVVRDARQLDAANPLAPVLRPLGRGVAPV